MGWNLSPPLLVAVDCLNGSAQEFGHLLLCLLQLLSGLQKFFGSHGFLFPRVKFETGVNYHNVACVCQ
jgi:hypothetical protein